MEDRKVVFRRIGGRIIPIKVKNGNGREVEKKAKETREYIRSEIKTAAIAAGVTGVATYAQVKGADAWLGKQVSDLRQKLKGYPKQMKPLKPVQRGIKYADDFGNVPLGRMEDAAKSAREYSSSLRGYASRLDSYTNNAMTRSKLSNLEGNFSRYRAILGKKTPLILGAAVAGSVVLDLSLGAYNYYHDRIKKK